MGGLTDFLHKSQFSLENPQRCIFALKDSKLNGYQHKDMERCRATSSKLIQLQQDGKVDYLDVEHKLWQSI